METNQPMSHRIIDVEQYTGPGGQLAWERISLEWKERDTVIAEAVGNTRAKAQRLRGCVKEICKVVLLELSGSPN